MFKGRKTVPYCVCVETGKNGTHYHTKQSKRKFERLDFHNSPSGYIIQPCTNHTDNYKKGTLSWIEVTKEETHV